MTPIKELLFFTPYTERVFSYRKCCETFTKRWQSLPPTDNQNNSMLTIKTGLDTFIVLNPLID